MKPGSKGLRTLTSREITDRERRDATRLVHRRAQDEDDARLLLDVLGLTPPQGER